MKKNLNSKIFVWDIIVLSYGIIGIDIFMLFNFYLLLKIIVRWKNVNDYVGMVNGFNKFFRYLIFFLKEII